MSLTVYGKSGMMERSVADGPVAVRQRQNDFVVFDHVQKSYDGSSLVVKDLNLGINRGEFLTMLGPSGSGKTTC
jgi:putative spermidine/putrescine transport system ATP-binding protein